MRSAGVLGEDDDNDDNSGVLIGVGVGVGVGVGGWGERMEGRIEIVIEVGNKK